MAELLFRSTPSDLEVSAGRTIVGIAVPFGQWATVSDDGGRTRYDESFRRGAFKRTIDERGPERVKAMVMHDRGRLPIGRASVLREDAAGLYAELKISRTEFGDEILELVRDGALDALSIGFTPDRHGEVWDARRSKVERTSVRLREISVVDVGAYPDALIAGVRALAVPSLSVEAAKRRLAILERL